MTSSLTASLPEASSATTLYAARTLRQKGLSVFRIPLGSKVPDGPWGHWTRRLPTDGELVQMFEMGQDGPSNIGIACGRVSGIVVVDADNAEAFDYCLKRLPYTPWRTYTAHGAHLYFEWPGQPVANRSSDLVTTEGPLPIHLRGDAGCVLAPGSLHPSGCTYRAAAGWDWPRTSLPVYNPAWLAPPPVPVRTRNQEVVSPDPTFVLDRARKYLAAIPRPEIGHGSDYATFVAACRLTRGFALAPEDAFDLLWAWCGNRDGWTRDWVAEKVANAARHGREAIGGMR
jgi:Bifunctional DNA primase/polymerase, N-terminal